jgi:hypothetical protein
MIQLLRSLLGESHDHPAKKPAPAVKAKAPRAGGAYRAVSISSATECHATAKDGAGKRYLLHEAPRLPLVGCAKPADCSCKFRKHADRRDGDRRLLGATETTRWFSGSERRKHGGRRATIASHRAGAAM